MRAPFRTLFVLAALAALLAVPTAASAYAPDTDEFVNCIRTTDIKIECVVELLHSQCLTEVVATRAKEAVMAAAERQAERRGDHPGRGDGPRSARGNPGVTGPGNGNTPARDDGDPPGNGTGRHPGNATGPGNGNGPPVDYEFHVPAKPHEGDIEVTIECGPKRVRGVLVASESSEPAASANDGRGAAVALTGIAGLVLALGAVELVASRRRRHS